MTSLLDPQTLQAAAAEVARLAGAELVARFKLARTVEFKHETDLVTDADTAAEQRIVDFLGQRFPGHGILAEERGACAGQGEYTWIVDPLDGTTNYAHRVPHFCVSVAVQDREGIAAAAVFDPVRGELFEAGRGRGAWLGEERLRVSREARVGRALLGTGFPYSVWDRPDRPLKLFDTFVRRAQGIRRAGSAALDMSYVAAGRYDGFFEFSLKPWDIAAGTLLVREAGGTVTDLVGAPLDFAVCDVMSSNGALHEELVRLSREALGGSP